MAKQLDNSTYQYKLALRRRALGILAERGVDAPVVLESHGGRGELWKAVYPHLTQGVVFETDPQKSATLGKQRPSWAVYESDCEQALAAGIGAHVTIDLLDVDPYGSPWNVLSGFFESERPLADFMVLAVNDGLRQKITVGGAWSVKRLADVVARHGNDLHDKYLEICREMMEETVSEAGYKVRSFAGYYCGNKQAMTHYLVTIEK